MRTLVISDLHLGASHARDLLRRADLREPLLDAVAATDRLVLLGDTLELREAPQPAVGPIAAPFFAEVGEALGPKGELLLLAGNHDHALLASWLDARLSEEEPAPLGLDTHVAPRDAGGRLAAAMAELAAPAKVTLAYPGAWLRPDVYATHGHYLDLHTTVPTFERLAAGTMGAYVAALPPDRATSDDYEAALAPLYAWMHALAQRSRHEGVTASAGLSQRAWRMLARDGRSHPVRTAALALGYRGAVEVLNAIGLGPLEPSLSGPALRRGGLRGITEVVRRLGITAPHVLFGHTHRSGPWPHDDPAEWTTPAGTRLHNTGSWVYQPHFLSDRPNTSPYWPGTAIVLDHDEPPRLERLLGDRGHDALRPAPDAEAAAPEPALSVPELPPLA